MHAVAVPGGPAIVWSMSRWRLAWIRARSARQSAPLRCAGSSRAGWERGRPDGSGGSRPGPSHVRTPISWIRSCAGLSVKLRAAGALEVKAYSGSPGILEMPDRARGRLECWRKWSFPVSVPGPGNVDSPGWIPVRKNRHISRFSLAGMQAMVPSAGLGQELRCEVELAEVRARGEDWWTLGFEATGLAGLLRGAVEETAMLGVYPGRARCSTQPGGIQVLRGVAVSAVTRPPLRRRLWCANILAANWVTRWVMSRPWSRACLSPGESDVAGLASGNVDESSAVIVGCARPESVVWCGPLDALCRAEGRGGMIRLKRSCGLARITRPALSISPPASGTTNSLMSRPA